MGQQGKHQEITILEEDRVRVRVRVLRYGQILGAECSRHTGLSTGQSQGGGLMLSSSSRPQSPLNQVSEDSEKQKCQNERVSRASS